MKKLILLLSTIVLTSCGGGGGSDSTDTETATSVSSLSRMFQTCGVEHGPIRIMLIGDSITESRSGYSSYRRQLWKNFQAAGCNVNFVGTRKGVSDGRTGGSQTSPRRGDFDQDHQAYWGRRTDEVLSRLPPALERHKPHVALIHLGTNDVLQSQSHSSTISDFNHMINTLRAYSPEIRIGLAQVIPGRGQEGSLRALNSRIPGLVAEKNSANSPILVVNQASGYSLSDNFDEFHPKESGEVKIADKFFNAVMEFVGNA